MICDCIHANVCRHRLAIDSAMSGIIEPTFGGVPRQWDIIQQAVAKICRFRTPWSPEKGKPDEGPHD